MPANPRLFEAEVQWHDSVGNPVERGVVQAATEITLRDLFAAAALAGQGEVVHGIDGYVSEEGRVQHADKLAQNCYAAADAMLRERERKLLDENAAQS